MRRLNYATAIKNAEHLIALGETTIYLYGPDGEEGFPWDKVVRVEASNSYRLSGPSAACMVAEDAGLAFRLDIEFEGRDANGRGISLFERDRLREVMLRLPVAARKSFASMLMTEALPSLVKHSANIREALNKQLDSEDCVRGLIAFAGHEVAR